MSLAKLSCVMPSAKASLADLRLRPFTIDTTQRIRAMDAVKMLVFRYFMGYWNNRRISPANGGLQLAVKRKRYYEAQKLILAV